MSLLDELRARLPDDCIQADPDVVAAYAQDRALFERPGTAAVLVMPRDTADVVATMAAARAAGAPVVTRGAGTGLCGGANAVDGCVILSMHRMDRVLHVDDANRTVRVQPGVLNGALKRAVAAAPAGPPADDPAAADTAADSAETAEEEAVSAG